MNKLLPATCLLAFCATTTQASPNMTSGLWEITVKSEIQGMPGGMGMPATTMTQCVKPADVQDGKRTVPQQDPKCEMKDYKMQGNTASWRFECKGPEAMSGSGSMTYSGNSYSGTTKMSMKQQGRIINMTQTYSGKRLGDCK